ncbi:MAG TPA: MYXO-CTERM sorting domain-containing protein [Polyangiaceae bacterium]|nr:MYXO-CTERM sorting domain-containing protein [Polyangiaceae bacterium]
MKSFRLLALAAGVACVSSMARGAWAFDAGTSADSGARDAGRSTHSGLDGGREASAVMDASQPPLAPPTHAVGKACKKDGDCASGLVCLTPATDSLGTGGPPGGLCTVSCAQNGQDDCDRVDTGSTCASDANGTFHYCYEVCAFGTPADDATKCHDRQDFACAPTQLGSSVCVPMCRGDVDCPGRVCDVATGLCANAASGTLPVGTACDPTASTTDCLGSCETLGNGVPTKDNSFCSYSCTLGRPGACGQSTTGSGPQPLGCVFMYSSTSSSGDVGECGQLCDCDSDCSNSGFVCQANPLAQRSGHTGACTPKLTFDGVTAGMPCGAGGSLGVRDAGANMDAAAPPAAGEDGGGLTPISPGGGCSCRTAAGADGAGGSALLAALSMLALRRRNARHTTWKQ